MLLKKLLALACNSTKSYTPLRPKGAFHVTLVLLLIMRSEPAYILNCMNCFKSRKASYVRHWSKQCTLEVSMMATVLVSSTILFPTRKLFL